MTELVPPTARPNVSDGADGKPSWVFYLGAQGQRVHGVTLPRG